MNVNNNFILIYYLVIKTRKKENRWYVVLPIIRYLV